jgi:hypothetical protein
LCVAGVVSVNALWKQAFATALAPPRKSGSTTLRPHTCTKPVLALTGALRWLISAFHNGNLTRLRPESGYSRGTASIVNAPGGTNHDARSAAYRSIPIGQTAPNLQHCQHGAFLE